MKSFFSRRNFFSSIVSVVLSVAFVASVAFASTTISTNIQTDGTLAVTGISTFNGQLQASSTALFGAGVTAYSTVLAPALSLGASAASNSLDGTLLLASQASDPVGVTQGTFYYNSTSKVLKMFDGTSWFTVGTTTSGISLTGAQLKLGDVTTQYLTLGTSTPFAVLTPTHSALVTIQSTTTTSVPLVIGGALNQVANLFNIRDNTNAKLVYVTSAGAIFASSTLQATGAVTAYSTLAVSGATTLSSTLGVTGLTTLGFASTSALSLNGTAANFMVNGMASTTSAGALSIQGKFGVGTTTAPSLEVSADSAATTTVAAFSSGSGVGGCIQLTGTNGTMYRMYVGAGDPATTTPNGKVGFIAVWQVGSCK